MVLYLFGVEKVLISKSTAKVQQYYHQNVLLSGAKVLLRKMAPVTDILFILDIV